MTWLCLTLLRPVLKSIFLSFCIISCNFFYQKHCFNWFSVIILRSHCLPWFLHAAIFWAPGFSGIGWAMCSPTRPRVQKETKTRWSTEKYCLLFDLFKCVISINNIIHVEQVVSNIKIPNHSPHQSAEECQRSHFWHNIQRFLLSLQQFFCQLVSPWHFIANVIAPE